MYDRDDSAPTLLSFLVGGIIGASLTCLLAPQTGVALRRKGRAAFRRITRAGRAAAGEASEVLISDAAHGAPAPGRPPAGGGNG